MVCGGAGAVINRPLSYHLFSCFKALLLVAWECEGNYVKQSQFPLKFHLQKNNRSTHEISISVFSWRSLYQGITGRKWGWGGFVFGFVFNQDLNGGDFLRMESDCSSDGEPISFCNTEKYLIIFAPSWLLAGEQEQVGPTRGITLYLGNGYHCQPNSGNLAAFSFPPLDINQILFVCLV